MLPFPAAEMFNTFNIFNTFATFAKFTNFKMASAAHRGGRVIQGAMRTARRSCAPVKSPSPAAAGEGLS